MDCPWSAAHGHLARVLEEPVTTPHMRFNPMHEPWTANETKGEGVMNATWIGRDRVGHKELLLGSDHMLGWLPYHSPWHPRWPRMPPGLQRSASHAMYATCCVKRKAGNWHVARKGSTLPWMAASTSLGSMCLTTWCTTGDTGQQDLRAGAPCGWATGHQAARHAGCPLKVPAAKRCPLQKVHHAKRHSCPDSVWSSESTTCPAVSHNYACFVRCCRGSPREPQL